MKSNSLFFYIFIFILILSISISGFSVSSGADFLKIPKSARAIGLGETSAGTLDGIAGIEYNPASISSIDNIALAMMYQKWIDNTFGSYLAGVFKLKQLDVGLSAYFFDYGGFTSYDAMGYPVSQTSPFDFYTRGAISVNGGLFSKLFKDIDFGCSTAFIYRNLVDTTSLGFIVDSGMIYHFSIPQPDFLKNAEFTAFPMTAGISFQNIGYSAEAMTPMNLSVELGMGIITNLNVFADVFTEFDNSFIVKTGLEYSILGCLALRSGLSFGKDSVSFNLGAGVIIPMDTYNLRLDYAFSPMDTLGNNHTVSLSVDFLSVPVLLEKYKKIARYNENSKDYITAANYYAKALSVDTNNRDIQSKIKDLNSIITNNKKDETMLVLSKTSQMDIINAAGRLCNLGYIQGAIKLLEEGLIQFPGDQQIMEALVILKSSNVVIITNQ